MENKGTNELIKIKQSIFYRIKKILNKIFSFKKIYNTISTFEEKELTQEEREKRKKEKEYMYSEIKYYNEIFSNLEEFLIDEENEIIENDNDCILENSSNIFEVEEEKKCKKEKNTESKERFFEIYENIKKGTVNVDDLSISNLLKVEAILRKEVSLISKIK